MNTQTQDYIIDHVGAENWEMIIDQFAGKNEAEILAELNEMFRDDDNSKLAENIYSELN